MASKGGFELFGDAIIDTFISENIENADKEGRGPARRISIDLICDSAD